MAANPIAPAATAPTPLDVLGDARTVLLTTFRKDGTAVPTPVWVMRHGDELWVWTNTKTGKYKRSRNNPAVTLAPCSMRGVPRGDAVPGTARLLSGAEALTALDLVRAKYGLFGTFAIRQSQLRAKRLKWPAEAGGLALTLV